MKVVVMAVVVVLLYCCCKEIFLNQRSSPVPAEMRKRKKKREKEKQGPELSVVASRKPAAACSIVNS